MWADELVDKGTTSYSHVYEYHFDESSLVEGATFKISMDGNNPYYKAYFSDENNPLWSSWGGERGPIVRTHDLLTTDIAAIKGNSNKIMISVYDGTCTAATCIVPTPTPTPVDPEDPVDPVDPDYTPDYDGQTVGEDGKLVPNAEHKAFGVPVDYNLYPQKTVDVPTVYLSTTETIDFTNKTETYYTAKIVIVDKNGTMKQRNEEVSFRGRGNATWDNQNFKKPWRLKFPSKTKLLAEQDENFNEINNHANAKSWTLLANYFDKSQIRNALTNELGQHLGLEFCPAYKFVDLMLKDATTGTYKYVGTYQVSDHVQVDPDRVNVDPATGWFLEANSGKRTGFLEAPYFYANCGSANMGVNIKNPEIDVLSETDQTSYVNDERFVAIKNWVTKVGSLANNLNQYNYDAEDNYRNYIDMESAINAFIGMDITGNYDGVVANNYCYKEADENSKLKFGPLWDMDLAWGNYSDMKQKHFWEGENQPFGYIVMNLYNNDPYFVKALYTRWQEIYNNGNLKTFLYGKVDELASKVANSAAKNFSEASWGYSGTLSISSQSWAENRSYSSIAETYTAIKDFIDKHIDFLNTQYAIQYTALGCKDLPECEHTYNDGKYVDNGNGTHTAKCDKCNALGETSAHTYVVASGKPKCSACNSIVDVEVTDGGSEGDDVYALTDASTKVITYLTKSFTEPTDNNIYKLAVEPAEGVEFYNTVYPDGKIHHLKIVEGQPYTQKDKYTALVAEYTRTLPAGESWGTLCLPFKVIPADCEGVKFYQLASVSNDAMVFEEATSTGGYTPLVFRKTSSEADVTAQNVSTGDISVKAASKNVPLDVIDGWQFVGVIKQTRLTADEHPYLYYISKDKFWHSEGAVNLKPFRAYFEAAAPSPAKTMGIRIDNDDVPTSIEKTQQNKLAIFVDNSSISLVSPVNETVIVYSLDGKMAKQVELKANEAKDCTLAPGAYIVNGQKLIVKE